MAPPGTADGTDHRTANPSGGAVAGLLALAGGALVWTVLLPLSRSSWPVTRAGVPRLDDAMTGVFAWTALAVAVWLTCGATLAAVAAAPGALGRGAGRLAQTLTPTLVRRWLTLLLGTGVGTVALPLGPALGAAPVAVSSTTRGDAGALPRAGVHPAPNPAFRPVVDPGRLPRASQEPAPSVLGGPSPGYGPTPAPRGTTSRVPDPRWLPSRPVPTADPEATVLLAPTPRASAVPDEVVTVRRGDSLWSLVARHLGPRASDRQIAMAWPEWYAANVDVIGPDPDLIRPGQQLRIPTHGVDR